MFLNRTHVAIVKKLIKKSRILRWTFVQKIFRSMGVASDSIVELQNSYDPLSDRYQAALLEVGLRLKKE